MPHLRCAAAMALLAFAPSIATAASSPQLATATSVNGGITSKSTFMVQAYVTLPQSCYAARIQQVLETPNLHRHFLVLQVPPSSTCATNNYTTSNSLLSIPVPSAY